MEMTPAEQALHDAAVAFAKSNRRRIAKEFTSTAVYKREMVPVSVFMAGCAGAGKTEAAIELIDRFDEGAGTRVMRIDPDEFRIHFVGYNGHNSWIFQKAATILVEKIHDLALDREQSFVFDGTLSHYDKAVSNIERSLGRGRPCVILFVYQKPHLAWQFTLAREAKEGRRIPADVFVDQFFGTRDVVNRLKKQFERDLRVDLLIKNSDGSDRAYKANVDRIQNHLHDGYDREGLLAMIKAGVTK